MAKPTVAQLSAALAAAEARAEGAEQALASLQSRLRHDYVEIAEYRRVQGVLRSTQQFLAKYKAEARPAERPVSDRRAAMNAARELAMSSGQTVSV